MARRIAASVVEHRMDLAANSMRGVCVYYGNETLHAQLVWE